MRSRSKTSLPTGFSTEDTDTDTMQLTQNDPKSPPNACTDVSDDAFQGEQLDESTGPKIGGSYKRKTHRTVRWHRPPPPKSEFKGTSYIVQSCCLVLVWLM